MLRVACSLASHMHSTRDTPAHKKTAHMHRTWLRTYRRHPTLLRGQLSALPFHLWCCSPASRWTRSWAVERAIPLCARQPAFTVHTSAMPHPAVKQAGGREAGGAAQGGGAPRQGAAVPQLLSSSLALSWHFSAGTRGVAPRQGAVVRWCAAPDVQVCRCPIMQRLRSPACANGLWPSHAGQSSTARDAFPPSQVMRVVDGRHSGLLCEVVALEPQEEGRSGGQCVQSRQACWLV